MHGTIPIISRECGVTEVLIDNEHALHFDPDDSADLTKKIRFVLENRAASERIVDAGRAFVKKHLTWDNYARNILQTLNARSGGMN
jgi:glycosyltransferase involved in cell wall biosynthesis